MEIRGPVEFEIDGVKQAHAAHRREAFSDRHILRERVASSDWGSNVRPRRVFFCAWACAV